MLFLQSLDFGVEVEVKLALEGLNLFPVLSFFILQISTQPFFLFPQLPNLKIALFGQPSHLHFDFTGLVVFLVAVFLELADFEFIFLSIGQTTSLDVLGLQVLLVFHLAYLQVLDVLDLISFLLQFLDLVKQAFDFHIGGRGSARKRAIMFVLP